VARSEWRVARKQNAVNGVKPRKRRGQKINSALLINNTDCIFGVDGGL